METQHRTWKKISRRIARKVIIWTICFLLIGYTQHVWWPVLFPPWPPITIPTDSTIHQDIEELLQSEQHDSTYRDNNTTQGEHSAAPTPASTPPTRQALQTAQQNYQELCATFQTICSRIQRQYTPQATEAYRHLLLMIGIVSHFDTFPGRTPFSSTLQEVIIHQDPDAWRWSAGHRHIRLNAARLDVAREFWEVATHELWHVLDLWHIVGNAPIRHTQFTEFGRSVFAINDPSLRFYALSRENEYVRKSGSRSLDFVSWYAMKNPFEDVAETINMYINHYEYFVRMKQTSPVLAQKFAIIEERTNQQHYATTSSLTAELSSTARQRDTTSLYKQLLRR